MCLSAATQNVEYAAIMCRCRSNKSRRWQAAFSEPCGEGITPAKRRAWQDCIYEVIKAMTAPRLQGEIGIERMCQLAGISPSGYYRHCQVSAPRREETGLCDAIQRLALNHRHYGYRLIGALLRVKAGKPITGG